MAASEHDPKRGPGYETRDIRVRPLLYAGVGLVLLAVAAQLGMLVLFDAFEAREKLLGASVRPLASQLRPGTPPEPRLQTSPLSDLQALRAWEDRVLTTYAWVDRGAGVVRIPVQRAKDLVLERGLPARRGERR